MGFLLPCHKRFPENYAREESQKTLRRDSLEEGRIKRRHQ